jgi:hypothetical protein
VNLLILSINICGWTLGPPSDLALGLHDQILLARRLPLGGGPLAPIALLHLAVGTQRPLVLWGGTWPNLLLCTPRLHHLTSLNLGRAWLYSRVSPSDLVRNQIVGKVYKCRSLNVLYVQLSLDLGWLPRLGRVHGVPTQTLLVDHLGAVGR